MTITGGQEDQSGKNDAAVKKLAHDFGVFFQREQIQAKIDESQRALDAVVKQQARLVKQNEDIHARIESNQRQKIQLEKSLVENKAELETLKNKLAANKKAQDSVEVASSQIKKVVEKHKQEQLLVH
jgi:chromosome segregation ATPase